ncbi:uncharacterized protein KY384_004220 [Bacidia gigantensis]|uniref:uncharacterized protein n=1 Tax=Bacidia gigantensis TaxID=2732470 RepID=UPI001D0397FE|nr:uncharacterized protein KY384_004220 [Bacidia gigantensis]KAG8530863.1 hypothetical protein KY384_004220 [Bacidia gigantensis]
MASNPPTSPRRPLPQPVEQTKKSNRATRSARADPAADDSPSDGPWRGLPQPVETTSTASKNNAGRDSLSNESRDASRDASKPTRSLPQPIESQAASSKSRRFLPEMVGSSRRSRRSTKDSPTSGVDDGEGTSPVSGEHQIRPFRRKRPDLVPGPPDNSPLPSTDEVPQIPPESKFSYSKLADKIPRRHSFRIPDLPSIRSTSGTEEESNASDVPSLSKVSSAESDPANRPSVKRRKKTYPISARDSEDERFSGYLLNLAAIAAVRQLHDQAMAAYPNENEHEPVEHYAFDRDSDDGSDLAVHTGNLAIDSSEGEGEKALKDSKRRHRESGSGWHMKEMRRHQSKLEEERRRAWASAERDPELDIGKSSQDRASQRGPPQPPKGAADRQQDDEINPMRKAAAPPMAGQDLRFPKCSSPRQTRVDPQNYPGAKSPSQTEQQTGLWKLKESSSRKSATSGLWMGVNAASAQVAMAPPRGIQSGLITPDRERRFTFPGSFREIPPTDAIASEFTDTFVTQLYNYLSLGYPVLARPYDPEISRITRVPLEELRKDDELTNARGYVGVPEGTGEDARGVLESPGERWKALRLYVWEWGRQQKGLWKNDTQERGWGEAEASYETGGGWMGSTARKGSWAW